MIISKTPLRISFFGGGTDYPQWYLKSGGQVVSSTIDKYIYISCRYLPPFFKHKHRIVYTKTEMVNDIESIKHPAVKELLKYFYVNKGLEIHYDGDLPSRGGMGSSSAFIVGLFNILSNLFNEPASKKKIAESAINLEQNIISEVVGSQDQVAASYGGFNHIKFLKSGKFEVKKINISKKKKEILQDNLLLFFSGISRSAPKVASAYVKNISKLDKELKIMNDYVNNFLNIIKKGSLDDVGYMLDDAWNVKKKFSSKVSNPTIDKIYNLAKKNGALGGKLLGAGAGGFIMFYANKNNHKKIIRSLNEFINVPFKFENKGSKIIFISNQE